MPFPLDSRFVQEVQGSLGRILPLGYVARMCRGYGGAVRVGNDVFHLFPILDSSDRKRISRTCNDIVRETSLARSRPGFPQNAVAIARNGGGELLVFMPECESVRFGDAVYRWNPDEFNQVADMIEELM